MSIRPTTALTNGRVTCPRAPSRGGEMVPLLPLLRTCSSGPLRIGSLQTPAPRAHCDSKPPLGNRARCFPDTTVIGAGSETPASVGSETLIRWSRCCHIKSRSAPGWLAAATGTRCRSAPSARGIGVLVPTKSAKRTAPRTLSPRQGDEAQRIERIVDPLRAGRPTDADSRSSSRSFRTPKVLRRIEALQRRGLAACRGAATGILGRAPAARGARPGGGRADQGRRVEAGFRVNLCALSEGKQTIWCGGRTARPPLRLVATEGCGTCR